MQRIFIAALAALSLALIAPAAASAQYAAPVLLPDLHPTPYPPVPGLEDHPFGFGANWAPDSPLEADFVDYVAWNAIESDYRLRAGAYDDSIYYAQSGLIGTDVLRPDARRRRLAGPDRPLRPARDRRVSATTAPTTGFVNGPVLPTPLNVFTQTSRHCDTYVLSGEGI